jgi:hypothetical protein
MDSVVNNEIWIIKFYVALFVRELRAMKITAKFTSNCVAVNISLACNYAR